MTRQELAAQRLDGASCSFGCISDATIIPQVCDPGDSSILRSEPSRPLSDKDYNQLPLVDLQALHQFRGMDPLHRADAMGEAANRGGRLKSYLKEKGVDKFLSNYKL